MVTEAETNKAEVITRNHRGCTAFYLITELRAEYGIDLLEAKKIIDEAEKQGKINSRKIMRLLQMLSQMIHLSLAHTGIGNSSPGSYFMSNTRMHWESTKAPSLLS
jgi:hypothetical protein